MTTSCVPVETAEKKLTSFMAKLKRLIDTRDNRGKRHELAYVLGHGFIIKLRTVSRKPQNVQGHQKNHQEQPENFGCWPLGILV